MEKNKDIYVHYGSNRFERELFLMPMNRLDFVISKPFGGMWASNIESEYGWKDWCEDNEFHFDIFIDHIYIANYEKILSLSDTRVSFVAQNKKITLTGNKLSLIKMLDDELLIQGNLTKVELE